MLVVGFTRLYCYVCCRGCCGSFVVGGGGGGFCLVKIIFVTVLNNLLFNCSATIVSKTRRTLRGRLKLSTF